MAGPTNLLESVMERLELWMLELGVVEAEKVVHDDVAGQCWECMGEIQWLFSRFKLLHTDGKSVDVAVDDVDEV